MVHCAGASREPSRRSAPLRAGGRKKKEEQDHGHEDDGTGSDRRHEDDGQGFDPGQSSSCSGPPKSGLVKSGLVNDGRGPAAGPSSGPEKSGLE